MSESERRARDTSLCARDTGHSSRQHSAYTGRGATDGARALVAPDAVQTAVCVPEIYMWLKQPCSQFRPHAQYIRSTKIGRPEAPWPLSVVETRVAGGWGRLGGRLPLRAYRGPRVARHRARATSRRGFAAVAHGRRAVVEGHLLPLPAGGLAGPALARDPLRLCWALLLDRASTIARRAAYSGKSSLAY